MIMSESVTARNLKGVVEITVSIAPGEHVKEYRSGDDRIGYFIVEADTREEAELLEKKVRNCMKFEVEEDVQHE